MLRGMALPSEPSHERRAVPRHMRDGEHDPLADTGIFGARATDGRGGRGRMIVYVVLVLAAAGLAAWLGLKP
jgi:hypothetical protein